MCGQQGHSLTSCPARSCLWCGQPAFDFLQSCLHCRKLLQTTCRVCGHAGHVARDCPDNWRRFHATLSHGEIVNPGRVEKPDADCWCCNCGARGHNVSDCYGYKFSKYPNTSLRVISYEPDSHHQFLESESPSQLQAQPKTVKKKKSKSCPSTPSAKEDCGFQSEPVTPVHRGFPSTLLVEKAIEKLDKRKKTKDGKETKRKKEKLNHEIIRLINQGKGKKQILAEILSNDVPDGEEDLGHAKLTDLMKVGVVFLLTQRVKFEDLSPMHLATEPLLFLQSSTPEIQYRLKCGLSGMSKASSQLIRSTAVGEKMPTTSTLQNANKQLESLTKRVIFVPPPIFEVPFLKFAIIY